MSPGIPVELTQRMQNTIRELEALREERSNPLAERQTGLAATHVPLPVVNTIEILRGPISPLPMGIHRHAEARTALLSISSFLFSCG